MQQVNLYLPEFRHKKDRLSLEGLLKVTAGVVGVLVLVSAFEFWQLQGSRSTLEERMAVREDTIARVNALADELGDNSEDPALAARVQQEEQNLEVKRAVLQFMESRELGNTRGFSEYLADLSRSHIDGLRLTGIELDNAGRSVRLVGEVSRAEYLPLYLQRLGEGDSYQGKSFQSMSIGGERDEAGLLQFSVTTDSARGRQ